MWRLRPLRLTEAFRRNTVQRVFFSSKYLDTHGRVYGERADKINLSGVRKMASQKIRIKLAAYDHELVDQAASRIVETMQKGGAKISGPVPLPTEREVVTILRSPHKYKDSREQFEIRTYKRIIDIYCSNAKLLDSIHLPAGVDIKVKQVWLSK